MDSTGKRNSPNDSSRLAKKILIQSLVLALLGGYAIAEEPAQFQSEKMDMGTQGISPPQPISPGSMQVPTAPSNILNVPPLKRFGDPSQRLESGNPAVQISPSEAPVRSDFQEIPPVSNSLMPAMVNPSETNESVISSGPETVALKPQKLEPGTAALNFSEANLRDIIRTVAEVTGENFIISPGLNARITVQTIKPVPKKDIFSIFESILEVNGLSAVKSGSYYKIVQAASAKQRGLELLNSPQSSDIPAGDRMMNVIVPIEFVSANELVQLIKPMLSQAGNVTLYSKANTLVITDNASSIKKTLELVETLDVDAFERMHIEIVAAQNVDIKTLNRELAEVFSALGFGKDTAQLALVPLERLNSLIILSSNDQLLSSVREWIERLDKKATGEGSSIHIYYVQNDKASNLKTILEQLYAGKKTIPLASGTTNLPQSSPISGASGDEIKIFIYEPSNALIIQSSQRDYQNILNTIQELDKIPKQVLIEALILEVKLDESTKYGIQWSALTGNFNLQQNTGLFSSTLNDPRSAISTPIGATAPSGLSVFATDASRFFAAIQALASMGKINVLSNPNIVVKNYEKASMNVGSDEPIATQSTQTAVTGTTGLIQTIEYRKTGVILTVTPHITEGGMVAMSIRQEVSDKSTDRTVGDRTYPSFTKREAETSIVAKDRQTLIIGGLIQDRKDKSDSGIPLLSRIPLLGNLFKFTSITESKTELIILITPRVISDSLQASIATDEFKGRLEELKKIFKK